MTSPLRRLFDWAITPLAKERSLQSHRRAWLSNLRPGDAVVCRMGKDLTRELGEVLRVEWKRVHVEFSGQVHVFEDGRMLGYLYELEPGPGRNHENKALRGDTPIGPGTFIDYANPPDDGAQLVLDKKTERAIADALARLPVCKRCGDSHYVVTEEGRQMCTSCPVPCQECRIGRDGLPGAFCATTPCKCGCHQPASKTTGPSK